MQFTFELENDRQSHHWLVIGKYHWWNLNIDVPSVTGVRIPFSSMDLADYELAFKELKELGVKFSGSVYNFVRGLAELRISELREINDVKSQHYVYSKQTAFLNEIKDRTQKAYDEYLRLNKVPKTVE